MPEDFLSLDGRNGCRRQDGLSHGLDPLPANPKSTGVWVLGQRVLRAGGLTPLPPIVVHVLQNIQVSFGSPGAEWAGLAGDVRLPNATFSGELRECGVRIA